MDRGTVTLAIAGLFATAALAAACGGKVGGAAGSGAASIVPATAPAYVAVDTDSGSSQWKTAEKLASRFPGKADALASLKRSLRDDAGLDYDEVKSALGPEVAVAWLDLDNGGQDVVALVQPDDEATFERLIAKGNAKDPENKLLHEQVGDWQALSEKQSVLDRFRSESNASKAKLADDETFNRAMDAVPDESLVKAYLNGTSVLDAIKEYGGPKANELVARAGTLEWLAAAVHASDDGVRFDTVVRGTPGEIFNGAHVTLPYEPQLPGHVPADALAYFTFHGTQGMLSGIAKTPQFSTPQLRPLAKVVREIESLLEGENALYVRGGGSGEYPEITLVTEPKSGTDGAATLDRILGQNAQLGIAPKQTSIKGIPARQLDLGPLSIDYANVDGHLVVSDLPSGILSFAAPSSTLEDSDAFKDAVHTAGLPARTQGYLYVNVRGGVELAQRLSHASIPDEVKRNLTPLRSALEYAVTRPSELQVTLFLRIQ